MNRAYLLIVTAVGEMATGLLLLTFPAIPLVLLLGVEQGSPEALLIARVAGAALLAIGTTCWLGRHEPIGSAQRGVIAGVLVYSTTVAALLVYAALALSFIGIVLWPAVVVHTALSIWCVFCLRDLRA
jgi:hypothetical protein